MGAFTPIELRGFDVLDDGLAFIFDKMPSVTRGIQNFFCEQRLVCGAFVGVVSDCCPEITISIVEDAIRKLEHMIGFAFFSIESQYNEFSADPASFLHDAKLKHKSTGFLQRSPFKFDWNTTPRYNISVLELRGSSANRENAFGLENVDKLNLICSGVLNYFFLFLWMSKLTFVLLHARFACGIYKVIGVALALVEFACRLFDTAAVTDFCGRIDRQGVPPFRHTALGCISIAEGAFIAHIVAQKS